MMPWKAMRAFRGLAASVTIAITACALPQPLWASEGTLVISTISDNLARDTKSFQPVADYLTPRLTAGGIRKVEVAVQPSEQAMVASLASGAVDIYIDSPFILASVGREVAIKPILRRWKGGVGQYHSVFVVRSDSGIATLDDLKGKVIAFDEPYSTSGYLLPKVMLLEGGYQLTELPRTDAPVSVDKIGYVFSGDDANTVLWVVRGKALGGVTDPAHFDELEAKRPGELKVLARSADIPRQVVAHRADLDPAIVAELTTVLIGMDKDPAGIDALQRFQKTARFDELPDAGNTFASINRMLDRLEPVGQ